jgi:NADH:ubiquinone oxidoreductase subunit C
MSLKEDIESVRTTGCETIDEHLILDVVETRIKEAVLEDYKDFEIFKELILQDLKKYSDKTSYSVIEYHLSNYKRNKKVIFGDWEK